MFRKMLIVFAAGCLGALVNSIALWLAGRHGVTQALGVAIAPGLSPHWLYPRIVWGGLWGFFFLIAWHDSRPVIKGLCLSLFPSAAQLLYFFPFHTHQGFLGLGLGALTPLVGLLFNGLWGVVTALAVRR